MARSCDTQRLFTEKRKKGCDFKQKKGILAALNLRKIIKKLPLFCVFEGLKKGKNHEGKENRNAYFSGI